MKIILLYRQTGIPFNTYYIIHFIQYTVVIIDSKRKYACSGHKLYGDGTIKGSSILFYIR